MSLPDSRDPGATKKWREKIDKNPHAIYPSWDDVGEGGQRKFQFPFLAFFVSLSTLVGEKYNYFSYAGGRESSG